MITLRKRIVAILMLTAGFTLASQASAKDCEDIKAINTLMTEHNLTELRGNLTSKDEDTRWYNAGYLLPNAEKCEFVISRPMKIHHLISHMNANGKCRKAPPRKPEKF